MSYTAVTFDDNHTNTNYWHDDNVFDYGFEGRCPSQAQVAKIAKIGIKSGAENLSIWWGENMIELFKAHNGQWIGSGWIRSISGDDLAGSL